MSTPMDIDRPERGTANGPSINIHRTLGGNASVSNLSDVMSTFRPNKVGRIQCLQRNLAASTAS